MTQFSEHSRFASRHKEYTMLQFDWHTFAELSNEQLYSVLSLRSQVFVVEQRCPYLDPDGNDVSALHLLGVENGMLVAYLRLFQPTETQNEIVFGRVVTAVSVRRKGYGKYLLQEMLVYCQKHFPGVKIVCSAQNYLRDFYAEFGFKVCGDVYDEDGIPHVMMEKIS